MAQQTLEQREKDMQEVQEISLEELKAHPEKILDALSQKHVSVVLKREDGENIRVFKKSITLKQLLFWKKQRKIWNEGMLKDLQKRKQEQIF